MNHCHKGMNLCFFSIEFARQFGGVGRFLLQLWWDHRFATSFLGSGSSPQAKKKSNFNYYAWVPRVMGWPRSGSPEIGSHNLIHDHQVFQGITKECCEANPLCNTLQCCRRQMATMLLVPKWFRALATSQLQAPKTIDDWTTTTGSQNNQVLRQHDVTNNSPASQPALGRSFVKGTTQIHQFSVRSDGQTMVRVETILKHAEDTCKIEAVRPLVPACQVKITSNFSEQTTKARQMNLRSNSFWTGRRPTAMWLLIPWTQETQETKPFGAMVIVDSSIQIISGWWFGTFFIFSIYWDDFHIFQMGRSTTNQIWWLPLD